MKKTHIFFLCYYTSALIGTAFAALFLSEYLNFSGWSVFPILYIAYLLYQGFYFPSARHRKQRKEYDKRTLAFYDKHPDMEAFERRKQQNSENSKRTDLLASRLSFLAVPFYFAFVIFFSKTAKILSVLPLFFLLLFWAYYTIYSDCKK